MPKIVPIDSVAPPDYVPRKVVSIKDVAPDNYIPAAPTAPGVWESLLKGLGSGAIGQGYIAEPSPGLPAPTPGEVAFANAKRTGVMTPEAQAYVDQQKAQEPGWMARAAEGLGSFVGSLPEFALGAVPGFFAGGPAGAMVGGSATAGGVRAAQDNGTALDVAKGTAIGAGSGALQALGAGLGGKIAGSMLTPEAATLVRAAEKAASAYKAAPSAATKAAMNAAYSAIPKSALIAQAAGRFAGQTVGGGVSPVLSGQMPSVRSFADAAAMGALFEAVPVAKALFHNELKAGAKAGLSPQEAAKQAYDKAWAEAQRSAENDRLQAHWENYADQGRQAQMQRLPELSTEQRVQQGWEQLANNYRKPGGPEFPDAPVQSVDPLAQNPIGQIPSANPTTPRVSAPNQAPTLPYMLDVPTVEAPRPALPAVEPIQNAATTGPVVGKVGVEPMATGVRGNRTAPTIIPDLPARPGLPGIDPMTGGPEPPRMGPGGQLAYAPGPAAPEIGGIGGGPTVHRLPGPPTATTQGGGPLMDVPQMDPYYWLRGQTHPSGYPAFDPRITQPPLSGIGGADPTPPFMPNTAGGLGRLSEGPSIDPYAGYRTGDVPTRPRQLTPETLNAQEAQPQAKARPEANAQQGLQGQVAPQEHAPQPTAPVETTSPAEQSKTAQPEIAPPAASGREIKYTKEELGVLSTTFGSNKVEIRRTNADPDNPYEIRFNGKTFDFARTVKDAKESVKRDIAPDWTDETGAAMFGRAGIGPFQTAIEVSKVFGGWAGKKLRGGFDEPTLRIVQLKPGVANALKVEMERRELGVHQAMADNPSIPREVVNRAAQGDASALAAIRGTSLEPAVQAFRQQADAASERLATAMQVHNPSTAAVIRGNKGAYMRRSYEIFDWPVQKLNDYIATKRNTPEWRQAASEFGGEDALVNYLGDLRNEGPSAAFFGRSSGTRLDKNPLTARKDLSPALRSVLGEHTDPVVNMAHTSSTLAHLVAQAEMQNDLMAHGVGKFIFDEANIPRTPDGLPDRANYMAMPEDRAYGPLAGKYIHRDVQQALVELMANPRERGLFGSIAQGLVGYTKGAVTRYNPVGAVRQVVSNPIFHLVSGDLKSLPVVWWGKYGIQAPSIYMRNALHGTRWGTTEGLTAFEEAMYRHELLDSNPEMAQLRYHAQQARGGGNAMERAAEAMAPGVGGKVVRGGRNILRRGNNAASTLYSASDNMTKIRAMLNKLEDYEPFFQRNNFTDAQKLDYAANLVADLYPNFNRMWAPARKFTQSAVSAPFPSYHFETLRVLGNALKLTRDEMMSGDPTLRYIAAKRAAGIAMAASIVPAVEALSKTHNNITPEKERSIRKALPRWMQESPLVYGEGKNGKPVAYDASYLQAFPTTLGFLNDIMRGRAADKSALDYAKSFIGGNMLLRSAMEAYYNQTDSGAQLYPEKATDGEKAWAGAKHVAGAFRPGIQNEIERGYAAFTGGKYKGSEQTPGSFALREVSGMTPVVVDRVDALKKQINDFRNGWNSLYYNRLRDKGDKPTPADKAAIAKSVNEDRKAAFLAISQQAKDMMASGVKRSEIFRALAKSGMGTAEIAKYINGAYRQFRPPKGN